MEALLFGAAASGGTAATAGLIGVGGAFAAAPALMTAATLLTGASAISTGNAARKQGEYNAAIATRNAGAARDQANADASAQQRMAYQKMGAARAGYAASGITSEGSPLDVLSVSAANAELDKQNILYKGELRAMGYDDTGALDMSRGNAAQKSGYVKGASSFLIAGGDYMASKPAATTGNKISIYDDPGF